MSHLQMHKIKTNTVALVDQDKELCRRIGDILNEAEFQLGAVCHSHGDAIRRIDWNLIDILLCGITDSRCLGGDFIRRVKAENPSLLAVFLAEENRSGILENGLNAGVQGFLLKRDIEEDLPFWLRHLVKGGMAIHPFIARSLIADVQDVSKPKEDPVLTHRELQILSMLGEGGLYKQIADHLGISVHTVHNHAKRIYAKLGVAGRSEAVQVSCDGPLARQLVKLRGRSRTGRVAA